MKIKFVALVLAIVTFTAFATPSATHAQTDQVRIGVGGTYTVYDSEGKAHTFGNLGLTPDCKKWQLAYNGVVHTYTLDPNYLNLSVIINFPAGATPASGAIHRSDSGCTQFTLYFEAPTQGHPPGGR